MVLLKDLSELFVKRREFLSGYRFLSRQNKTQAVESDVKTHSFLPLAPMAFLSVSADTFECI